MTTLTAADSPAIFGIAIGNQASIPAVGHLGLLALCALLLAIGLLALRMG